MWQYILTILIGLAAALYIGYKVVRNLRKLHRGKSPCSCCPNESCRNRSRDCSKCDKQEK